ncbi:MAG: hypothetical protein K0Q79_3631 [Flavipsychrobacter sp.]|jgi:hypothetical protein|nr:hypothetical protein [Flavipsychrobacter sp.]
MNRFNEVFLAIKKQCFKQRHIAEIDCFEKVAKEAKIPLDKLHTYLKHLQDIGVIKYSVNDKYIYLTTFGRKQETLMRQIIENIPSEASN